MPSPDTTRLAPSPTGSLHLGNARTFLINWLLAKQHNWSILLRIEDLDAARVKPGSDTLTMEDLAWLGLTWDTGPVYQSPRSAQYRQAVNALLAAGRAYPCVCTRKDIESAAGAPHAEDATPVYPGTCRDRFTDPADAKRQSGRDPVIRFRCPDQPLNWTDAVHGPVSCNPARQLGDFIISRADGSAAYQLAVVVNDAEMQINKVVRGDDLIDSTMRQILLYDALNLQNQIPDYWHVPLVLGPDNRRLAKRHGDSRVAALRQAGVPPQHILALLARWSGIPDPGSSPDAASLIPLFNLANLPRQPIIFTPDDDHWLRQPA